MSAKIVSIILPKTKENSNLILRKFAERVFELSSILLFMAVIQFVSQLN